MSNQFSWVFGSPSYSEGSRVPLRQVSPESFCKSPFGIKSGWSHGQAEGNPWMCPQDAHSLFGIEETYFLMKEGILALTLQNLVQQLAPQVPVGRGEWRGQDCSCVGRGPPWLTAFPVSQSPHPQGAPPPLGRSPLALPQSPTETSWSGELGTLQLSASERHPRQRCGRRKRKPTENRE